MADWSILRPLQRSHAPSIGEIIRASPRGGGGGMQSELLRLAMEQGEERKKAAAQNALAQVVQAGGSPEEISQRAFALGTPEAVKLGLEFKKQAGSEAETAWERQYKEGESAWTRQQKEKEFALAQGREARGIASEERATGAAQEKQKIEDANRKISRINDYVDFFDANKATFTPDQAKTTIQRALDEGLVSPEVAGDIQKRIDENPTDLPAVASYIRSIAPPRISGTGKAGGGGGGEKAPAAPKPQASETRRFNTLVQEAKAAAKGVVGAIRSKDFPAAGVAAIQGAETYGVDKPGQTWLPGPSDIPGVAAATRWVTKLFTAPETQKIATDVSVLADAISRIPSGAVVGKEELMRRITQYMPTPGESEESRQHKGDLLEEYIDNLISGSAAEYPEGPATPGAGASPPGGAAPAPAAGWQAISPDGKETTDIKATAERAGMSPYEAKRKLQEAGWTIQ